MACSNAFINTLRRYGARSASNELKLKTWLDEAIESVAEGKGGHVTSASANGASFSMDASMTNSQWAACLDKALHMLELNLKSTSRSYGSIV
jgi:hypothetical protein